MKKSVKPIVTRNNPNSIINKKTYLVNIDKISITKHGDYLKSRPIIDKIEELNKLYEEGHDIHYWTNRGINNISKSYHFLTYRQLHEWKVNYCSISIGKPTFNWPVYEDI